MKKNNFVVRSFKNQRNLYIFLIGLALLAFIFGIIFIFLIDKDSQLYIKESINNYYMNYNSSFNSFFKALFNNYIYLILIFILGISIIGIPFVIIMYLYKCFIFGFSFSSLLYSFGFKGLIISIFSLVINKLLFLVILLLISFYSISFSIKLFKYLFLKKSINFIDSMNKYIRILLISLISSLIISIYEGFISSYILKLFNI